MRYAMALGAAWVAAAAGGECRAAFIVNVTQVGNTVVAIGSGRLDTNGLTADGPNSIEGTVYSTAAYIVLAPGGGAADTEFVGLVGPKSFGSLPNLYRAVSSSGDVVGIIGSTGYLFVPSNYVSGAALSDTATFAGTLADLGLNGGTYTYTFGTGADADSFTVNIATVPEPASMLMTCTALGTVALAARARRARPTPAGASA